MVIAPNVLPAWDRVPGPSHKPSRVTPASIWGKVMYPEMAKVVDTPTHRKCQAPLPAQGAGPHTWTTAAGCVPGSGSSHGSEGEQSDSTSVTVEPVEHCVPAEDLVSADTEGVGP